MLRPGDEAVARIRSLLIANRRVRHDPWLSQDGAAHHLHLLSASQVVQRCDEAILTQADGLAATIREGRSGHDEGGAPLDGPYLGFIPLAFAVVRSCGAHSFPRLRRKDGNERGHAHLILIFDRPVRGPMLLGAGRCPGYGVCPPLGDARSA